MLKWHLSRAFSYIGDAASNYVRSDKKIEMSLPMADGSCFMAADGKVTTDKLRLMVKFTIRLVAAFNQVIYVTSKKFIICWLPTIVIFRPNLLKICLISCFALFVTQPVHSSTKQTWQLCHSHQHSSIIHSE